MKRHDSPPAAIPTARIARRGGGMKTHMYETPSLSYVGAAQDVVLGQDSFGGDLYSEINSQPDEFARD
jgi:hypothetical protein